MTMEQGDPGFGRLARNGCLGLAALNGAALIAVLSAMPAYSGDNYIDGVTCAIKDWTAGAGLALLAWAATLGAGYMRQPGAAARHRPAILAAIVLGVGALGCFVWGGFTLAGAIDASG